MQNQKKSDLFLWISLVIIAAIIIGGVGLYFYFISQQNTILKNNISTSQTTTDDTTDWKTYTNDKYGFSFKYPNDWETKSYNKEDYKELNLGDYELPVISLTSPEQKKINEKAEKETKENSPYYSFAPIEPDISIYYYPTVVDETENKANNYGATSLEDLISKNNVISKIGTTTLEGNPAVEVIWGGYGATYAILSVKTNHLYKISFGGFSEKKNITDTEKKIISTFKFTQ